MKNRFQIVRARKPRNPPTSRRIGIHSVAPGGSRTPTETPLPFRWDITRASQLGGLLEGEYATGKDFLPRLLACCARVVAFAGDSDLVFVGRSPESLFDLLSGLLSATSWQGRLTLLQFSTGYGDEFEKRRTGGAALNALRVYLDSLNLSPAKLIVRERPVSLIDLVCSGDTFRQFLRLLHDWARETRADWPAVRRKIRMVGIVRPGAPSAIPQWKRRPKPYLWRDHAEWLNSGEFLERGAMREVSLDRELWEFLGERQGKTTLSYRPELWGRPDFAQPYRSEDCLKALRLARRFFETGRKRARRAEFAALLGAELEMRQKWLRKLALEIRSGSQRDGFNARSTAAAKVA